MTNLPNVGEIGAIPISMIRPFWNQPRKHFDEASLRDLADSIAQEGQRTPAWVMPIGKGQYELIAGERRWRACQLAEITTLRCEVRAPEDASAQYIDSVMENFGRKDCTSLEAARAIAGVIRIRFGPTPQHGDKAASEVAKVFARSQAWVHQHLGLLRLHPEVQDLLESGKISTSVAFALSNLQPEVHLPLAREISGKKMRLKPALTLIRGAATNSSRISQKGRQRKPSDDFSILARFLNSLGEQAEALLAISTPHMAAMFAHRPPESLATVRKVLRRRIEELGQLETALQEVGD